MSPAIVSVPLAVRVAVAHAAAQQIAEAARIDVLHIKGPALDPSIAWAGREGTDADILVRSSQAAAMVTTLRGAGWELHSRFENSSAFQHSATLWHHHWGYLDVHRHFPGIGVDPDLAFQRLWANRQFKDIAGVACPVPSIAGQTLILLLHAARAGGSPRGQKDIGAAWHDAPPERRHDVIGLVEELHAQIGFAAATGDLDDFRGAKEYDLWSVALRGGTRFEEWRARVRAAPTRPDALRVALRATLVNTDHLAMSRGHRPTHWEIVVEFFARPIRGLRQVWASRYQGPSEGMR